MAGERQHVLLRTTASCRVVRRLFTEWGDRLWNMGALPARSASEKASTSPLRSRRAPLMVSTGLARPAGLRSPDCSGRAFSFSFAVLPYVFYTTRCILLICNAVSCLILWTTVLYLVSEEAKSTTFVINSVYSPYVATFWFIRRFRASWVAFAVKFTVRKLDSSFFSLLVEARVCRQHGSKTRGLTGIH